MQLQCDHPSSIKFPVSLTKPIIMKHSTLPTYWQHLRLSQQGCKRFKTFSRCDAVLLGDVLMDHSAVNAMETAHQSHSVTAHKI